MGALATVTTTLASSVANTTTFTVAYPSGITQARLLGCSGGRMVVNGDVGYDEGASGFTASYGASNITVTNKTGAALAAGSGVILSFGENTRDGSYNVPVMAAAPVVLTAATGTASNTIADVGAAFNQTTLNNNFKSLASKLNEVLAALEASSVTT